MLCQEIRRFAGDDTGRRPQMALLERTQVRCFALIFAAWAVACAPAAGPSAHDRDISGVPPDRVKALTVALGREPAALNSKLNFGSGVQEVQWIFAGFLAAIDPGGTPHPMLADDLPSRERGTWVVHSDGTMETTWRLRPSPRWHDGTPMTSKDYELAWRVYNDREFPGSPVAIERLMSAVEPVDERTFVIRWRQPYIYANALDASILEPIPSHQLEALYVSDKQTFVNGRHWTTEYIGSGPFKVESWEPGSQSMSLTAYEGYALGRPKIDRLHLRFIPDPQTAVAGLLARSLDVALEPPLDVEAIVSIKSRWEAQGGTIVMAPAGLRYVEFQHRDVANAQVAVRDARVRRAIAHATDRQSIADTQPPGAYPVAHFPVTSNDPVYAAVDRAVPKYEFDPLRAERLLDEAGWRKGDDGIRVGVGAGRLAISIWARTGPDDETGAAVFADNWKRVGADTSINFVAEALTLDNEYRSSFPATNYASSRLGYTELAWTADNMPNPARRYAGKNRGGYSNPEADALAARVLVTVEPREREQVLVDLMRIWTDEVGILPIHYRSETLAAAKGVGGFRSEVWPAQGTMTWNIHEWTVE